MDFRSRGVQSPITPSTSSSSTGGNGFNGKGLGKWLNVGPVVLLVLIALLVLAIAAFTAFGGSSQEKIIKGDKYQAVFLNNGQVYFGHIKDINKSFVNLDSIYYLQTNNTGSDTTAAANSNVTLVKLGCELHGPYDQMVINADQVLLSSKKSAKPRSRTRTTPVAQLPALPTRQLQALLPRPHQRLLSRPTPRSHNLPGSGYQNSSPRGAILNW
jgi:hypothetical protein